MSNPLPLVYLARHGETEWTITGQHTGLTDIPLTRRGENNARTLAGPLNGIEFAHVFTSPLQRAMRTCALAGFAEVADKDADIVEWNYGNYEGLKTSEIRKDRPGWDIFKDGCPGGEVAADVAARADRFIAKVRKIDGNVLFFSHGHFLRVFTARWLDLDPTAGRYFYLDTAALSIVGYNKSVDDTVIRRWNDCRHVCD